MATKKSIAASLSELKEAGTSLVENDWSGIYEVMKMLHGNHAEIKKFSEDPKKYFSKNKLILPKGCGIISYRDTDGFGFQKQEPEVATASGVRVLAEQNSQYGVMLTCVFCGECKS